MAVVDFLIGHYLMKIFTACFRIPLRFSLHRLLSHEQAQKSTVLPGIHRITIRYRAQAMRQPHGLEKSRPESDAPKD